MGNARGQQGHLTSQQADQQPGQIGWLRSHVQLCMQDVWDVCRVHVDDDGDVPFRTGAVAGWIAVLEGDPLVVRVWAHAALGVKGTAAVLREVNDVNRRCRTASVYWDAGLVVVEQALRAESVSVESLRQAWRTVSTVGNDLGPMLVAVHGGETPFPADDDDGEQRLDDAEAS